MNSTRITRILLTVAAVVCSSVHLQAQSHSKSVQIEAGDVQGQPYTLDEVGAVVVHNSKGMQVLFVMEPGMRTEPYKEVDLQAEDIILMANGKKLASIDDLKDLMEGLAPGDQVQLGIKRDKDMQIVRFLRADPESLPKVRRMMVTADEGPDGTAEKNMSFQSEGGEERVAMLRGIGIIARETEDGVQVAHLMPHSKEVEGLNDVAEEDLLVSLQGASLGSIDELDKMWESIKVGEKVTMVCSRDGKESTHTFTKPDASDMQGGAVMITK